MLVTAGCAAGADDAAGGGDSGTSILSGAAVEQQIVETLTAQVGAPPQDVSCPGELGAEMGETMRCELTDAEAVYGVTVEVLDTTGSVAELDVAVDAQPLP